MLLLFLLHIWLRLAFCDFIVFRVPGALVLHWKYYIWWTELLVNVCAVQACCCCCCRQFHARNTKCSCNTHANATDWRVEWINYNYVWIEKNSISSHCMYLTWAYLFHVCMCGQNRKQSKNIQLAKMAFTSKNAFHSLKQKPPSRYSNELSMLSLIFILIHAFSVVDSVDSFNFRLSIDFTRPIWLINRVHRASNRWREMMNRFTGRRSIHFPMRQMLHDRQAANRFAHIHATTLTHGIWRIMHIFKGMGNRLRGSRFFVIDIAFNLIDNRTEINIHEYRPTKSMTSLSAT